MFNASMFNARMFNVSMFDAIFNASMFNGVVLICASTLRQLLQRQQRPTQLNNRVLSPSG